MKNAALIGLGMVAETHLAALHASTTVSLAGVLGRDLVKARTFAAMASDRMNQKVGVFEDAMALVADPAIDFVILATPPDARVGYVRTLSAAGKPILMEKPIERSLAAATEIIDLCDAAAVPVGLVFQHRARAASAALKQRLETGDLGRIVNAEIRVPWWRDQAYYDEPGRGSYDRDGGGVLLTQAIHTLDLALWTLGPFRRVQALLRTTDLHEMEAEDWAGALFETTSGAVGTIMATTAAYPGASETLAFHGTKGSAHLESGVLSLTFADGRQETIGDTVTTGGGADPMAFTHDWHQSIIENFADCLESGACPMASGREGLRAHALIDAMERANASGKWTEVTPP